MEKNLNMAARRFRVAAIAYYTRHTDLEPTRLTAWKREQRSQPRGFTAQPGEDRPMFTMLRLPPLAWSVPCTPGQSRTSSNHRGFRLADGYSANAARAALAKTSARPIYD